jgi:hypothetical protein
MADDGDAGCGGRNINTDCGREDMTEQDNKQLKEIRERLNKATPGKWSWHEECLLTTSQEYLVLKPFEEDNGNIVTVVFDNDKDFIAHAPEDVDALLAMVDSLNQDLEAAIEDMESLMWHSGDGCTICAHAIKDTRVDYSKYDCDLVNANGCYPKYRGRSK